MNRKLLFLLFFATLEISAQTLSYKGSKPYPATNEWNFICENYALTGITNVQVAKTEKGGLLRLAVKTTNPTFIISGTAYLFLADNSVITCTDKAMREVSGEKIISYYIFSPAEMSKLKTTEIQSIHFNIKGNNSGFRSQLGNFTAVNRKSYFATAFDKSKKSYDTVAEINALYQ